MVYIKLSEITDLAYYQKNRNVILNKAKDYYKNNNKKLKEQARDKYRSLSEEEKDKKREYGKNRYHNMSEEKKEKEYQKKYYETNKALKNKYFFVLCLV